MSASILRNALRGPSSSVFRASTIAARPQLAARARLAAPSFSTTSRALSEHQEETFEEFTAR